MTECERFIKEGLFTPDFFKPEVRCDFLVTTERKKLWAIQMDLYLKLAQVCERHGLRYFAFTGTLLGAARHNGFVPWDDDVDIVMPRADYERLVAFEEEFQHPYFLQVPGRDGEYSFSYMKVRNSRTAQVSRPFMHHKFNQGVQIDIFPLDRWDYEEGRAAYARINELNIDNSNYMRQGYPNPDESMLSRMKAWSGRSARENLREIYTLSTQFNVTKSLEWFTCPSCTIYPYERFVFKYEWIHSIVRVPFESIQMQIPSFYNEILSVNYGDWHKFPPVESRGEWHGNESFDPDRSYKDVADELLQKSVA